MTSLDEAGLAEIVIVDNQSTDGSVALASRAVPRALVVRTGSNLGYGGGVNRGMKVAANEFVLVCNSDLSVGRDAVAGLAGALASDERVALVGPQLIDEDGTASVSARAFPTIGRSWRQAFAGVVAPRGRSARRYAAANQAIADLGGDVDWVTGACFLVRRQAFEEVHGFDVSYFMYVEEVDLCWRLHKAGWRVLHEPSISVTHVGGVSAGRRPYAMVVAHHRSLWRFSKTTAEGRERLALPLVAVAIALRAVLVLARQALSNRRLSDRAARRRSEASGP